MPIDKNHNSGNIYSESHDDELVGRLVCEYMDRLVDGDSIDIDDILSRHPHLGSQIVLELETFTSLSPDQKETDNLALGTLGDYHVLRKIGHGGMGVVYEAEQTTLGRRVALKTLPTRLARDVNALERFKREARLLAAINHPNIVTIHSFEESDGVSFLTMELVHGETLARRLADVPLPVKTALSICRQLARALEGAHKSGVLHRDLKPSNLSVTPEGRVKVFDFGLATALLPEPEGTSTPMDSLTSPEAIVGTPGYMSPEQVRGRGVAYQTDIWAFGCILYECLTARCPFRGDTPVEANNATIDGIPDWNALPTETPVPVRDLLERCLARDPQKRPDIRTARRELDEVVIGQMLANSRAVRRRRSDGSRSNLPYPLSGFVGRKKEICDVRRLLKTSRLVTLTGAGGCGKTRLALEVARESVKEHKNGVWLVELARVSDAAIVPQTLARVFGLREVPDCNLSEVLMQYFKSKNHLLVFDNCEHLVSACADLVSMLLAVSPDLRCIATSREALGVSGELVCRVPPLAVPDEKDGLSLKELSSIDAVHLFVERARAVNDRFELTEHNVSAIGKICRRLDGIPLALELAAARVNVLSPAEIAERLDERFRLLNSGSRTTLPRHQTLSALIDWSYEQLSQKEQALFRRVSVFLGGWTLEAAETVCSENGIEDWEVLEALSRLVDKSLVETSLEGEQEDPKPRYRMLETVRHFALSLLRQEKESAGVERRHRHYYLEIAEKLGPRLQGADEGAALLRLAAEHDNFRAALNGCTGENPGRDVGMRLAAALGRYWLSRGHWTEARLLHTALLDHSDARPNNVALIRVLNSTASLACSQGEYRQARTLCEESLEISREIEDREGTVDSLRTLGRVHAWYQDLDEARSFFEESLAGYRELDNKWGVAASFFSLAALAHSQGDHTQSRFLCERGLRLSRELGNRQAIAEGLHHMGNTANEQGEYATARGDLEESLAIGRQLGSPSLVAGALMALGNVAFNQGDYAEARSLYKESLRMYRELGNLTRIAASLHFLGCVAQKQEQLDEARLLFEECLSIRRAIACRGLSRSLSSLGEVAMKQENYAEARTLHAESLAIRQELGQPPCFIAMSLAEFGILAAAQNDPVRAVRLLTAAERFQEGSFVPFPLNPSVRKRLAGELSMLRRSLCDGIFTKAQTEGGALALEQAIEYALA